MLFSWGLLGSPPVWGQTQQQIFSPWLVREVRLEGNRAFPDETLRLYVRTTANRQFLGIPGLTWWLWLYELGASGRLGGALSRALMASGEPPAYYDTSLVTSDVERLTLFYHQEGFPQARVEAYYDTLRPGLLRITFHIDEGPPTFLRQITYAGLEHLTPAEQRTLMQRSALRHRPLDLQQPLHRRAQMQRYSELSLLEERRHLMEFLWNAGFAAVTRDSIRAIVIPARPDSFDLILQVHTGPRYRLGDLYIEVDGPEPGLYLRRDTLVLPPVADSLTAGRAIITRRQESRLKPAFLTRMLQVRPGQWYSYAQLLNARRRLEATGLFTYVRFAPLWGDTTYLLGEAAPRLPLTITLTTRPRHRLRLETFMLQRSGPLTGAENELGAGIAATYENANLLGNAETFSLRTAGSISGNFEEGLLTSAQIELTASLLYPYAIIPFGALERWLRLYDARTRLSLSWLTARRDALRLAIRGRGTARFRLELQHTAALTSLIDLIDLSLSNPDTLNGFRAAFLDEVLRPIEDPVQRAQLLDDYTVPQINDALRYTLQAARLNPLLRDQGYLYELTFEAGALISELLDRYVFTPGMHEGTLPGLPFFRQAASGNRLLYRPYVRLTTDLRQYQRLQSSTVFAWKLQLGWAQPVGIPDVIPFDRRFYSGGASSVRGWPLRGLGPGRIRFAENLEGANLLGGEIKFEASAELRQRLLHRILAADWIGVIFTDVGNVWLGPRNPGPEAGRFRFNRFYRELAWSSGLGLRLAWEYLIVRLDLAYRIHDPARTGTTLLPDGLHRPMLHFGIGHTF
jgi:outer membrane protein insertion porin family